MTITEFLTARYDEEWRAAQGRDTGAPIHQVGCFYYNYSISPMVWTAEHCDCEPEVKARVLADIAAKRAIVKFADVVDGMAETIYQEFSSYPDEEGADLLKILVQPYADHPDFDPAWRVA